MATVAEMRARLAKYAQPKPNLKVEDDALNPNIQSPAARVDSSGQETQADSGNATVAGDGSVVANLNATATPGPTILGTSAAADMSSRQNIPALDGTIQSSIPISTELQPTTLVIVERPLSSGVESDTGFLDGGDSESKTNLDVSNPIHQSFLQRLADLETALLQRDPLMRTHLGMIHKTMIEYEEIANLLTVDEIRKIMTAQQSHTNLILKQDISKTAGSKKAPKVTLDDI